MFLSLLPICKTDLRAKVARRLVCNQNHAWARPDKLEQLDASFLTATAPDGIAMERRKPLV